MESTYSDLPGHQHEGTGTAPQSQAVRGENAGDKPIGASPQKADGVEATSDPVRQAER